MQTINSESIIPLAILALGAAGLHASLQLATAAMTLLSGHSLGAKRSHKRLLHLNFSYVCGAALMVFLLGLGTIAIITSYGSFWTQNEWWRVAAAINLATGLAIAFAYYRKGRGTVLWLPRSLADHITIRAKKTKRGVEAFSLGMTAVVAELPFAIGPLLTVSLVAIGAEPGRQATLAIVYSLITCLPLLTLLVMVGGGHRISTIQRWREQSKTFWRYATGGGFLLIAFYIAVLYMMEPNL